MFGKIFLLLVGVLLGSFLLAGCESFSTYRYKKNVKSVIASNKGEFQYCACVASMDGQVVDGRMEIRFKINESGKVTETWTDPEVYNKNLAACVINEIMKMSFESRGEVAEVNYPFVFVGKKFTESEKKMGKEYCENNRRQSKAIVEP
ncbi:MAG: hypothetical protein B7Y39_02220 [Bdellovibrio sp. 28-41-41]|nr:MAG: hypothetical protein B7Y39_02220 [Bdellovibrio sp. 28-41-41]